MNVVRVDQYANSTGGVYDVRLSIGHCKTVHIVLNEDDNLLDTATHFCALHKLDAALHKDVANKLREAIQMKAIGMSHLYESAVTESETSPLLKSAEKLITELQKKRKQGLREMGEKRLNLEKSRRPSVSARTGKGETKRTANDLYAKDMLLRAAWEEKRRSLNEEARRREMEGVTFAPALDAVTRVMAKHMPGLETRMNERVAKAKAKIEVLRKNSAEKEKSKHTFRPSINPSYCSGTNRPARSGYRSVFNNLYEDSKRRSSARMAKSVASLSPEHTFRPDINPSQKGILGSSRMSPAKKKNSLFDTEPLIDPKTKQPLFTPLINKRSSVRRDDSGSVGKRLYESRKSSNNPAAKKTTAGNPSAPQLVTKKKTKELISSMRTTTFTAIFSLLDSDNDGVVKAVLIDDSSKHAITCIELPKDVWSIYEPLFSTRGKLTLQEFMEESNKLFDKLSINQRNALFSFARSNNKSRLNKSKSVEQFAFAVLLVAGVAANIEEEEGCKAASQKNWHIRKNDEARKS